MAGAPLRFLPQVFGCRRVWRLPAPTRVAALWLSLLPGLAPPVWAQSQQAQQQKEPMLERTVHLAKAVGEPDQPLRVFTALGDTLFPADTLQPLGEQYYRLADHYPPGPYRLGFDPKNSQWVFLSADMPDTLQLDAVAFGRENFPEQQWPQQLAYRQVERTFLQFQQGFQQRVQNYGQAVRRVSSPAERRRIMDQEFLKMQQYVRDSLNTPLQALAEQYPNTFAAEVLVPFYQFPEPDTPEVESAYDNYQFFLQGEFLRNWPWNDPRLARAPNLMAKVNSYLNYFIRPYPQQLINASDDLLARAEGNPALQQQLLNNLVMRFNQQGPAEALEHLVLKYLRGPSSGQDPDQQPQADPDLAALGAPSQHENSALSQVRSRVEALQAGKRAPDFVARTRNDQEITLQSVLGKPVTILTFWAPGCSHCEAQLPELQAFADTNEQVTVLALQMHPDLEYWKSTLRLKAWESFIHATQNDGPLSPVVEQYLVKGTPTYFLIDQNGRFALRTRYRTVEDVVTAAQMLLE